MYLRPIFNFPLDLSSEKEILRAVLPIAEIAAALSLMAFSSVSKTFPSLSFKAGTRTISDSSSRIFA